MTNEILNFSDIRVEARAYLTYLLTRNIPNRSTDITIETVIEGLKRVEHDVDIIDALYILDPVGLQLIDNISRKVEFRKGKGHNRATRAYYYRALRDKRTIMTDPYPSILTGELCISSAMPIYNDAGKLKFIAVIDVSLKNILKIIYPSKLDEVASKVSKVTYFAFSFGLLLISILLFVKGIMHLTANGVYVHLIDLKELFESTILLTLSLAIFDLVKAIFEEEVLGRYKKEHGQQLHRTMTRFMGSIVIAIAIEALMLVFKSTLIDPSKLIYAVYLLGGVTLLLFGLAFYIKSVTSQQKNNE